MRSFGVVVFGVELMLMMSSLARFKLRKSDGSAEVTKVKDESANRRKWPKLILNLGCVMDSGGRFREVASFSGMKRIKNV